MSKLITMLPFKAFLFLITICVAKSEVEFETMCKNDYRDKNNNQIDVLEYCSNKLCIEKCCGPREMLYIGTSICVNTQKFFNNTKKKFPAGESLYKSINILSSLDVNKKSKKNVVFVQNHRNFRNCTSEEPRAKDYEISEDGSLRWLDSETKKWKKMKKLKYCIDYRFIRRGPTNEPNKREPGITITIRTFAADPQESDKIESFQIVAILISSFFLMLVLVVYCLLPDLRNLSGLVLMAYTFSILFAFVIKLIQTFIKRDPPDGFCRRISPVVYFAFMSSIFWLSVISFDVWWGLRFSTYTKLSVMMGVSWCLELIPEIEMLWYYIPINLYNLLIGVTIFYLFVCKKKILVQLCKKFNIRNDFVKKLEAELLAKHTKSGITRTTGVASSIVKNRSKDENKEEDLLKNCPKEESIL